MMPSRTVCILLHFLHIGSLSLRGQESDDPGGRGTPIEPMNVLLIAIDDLRPELASYQTDGIRTPPQDSITLYNLFTRGRR